MADQGEPLFDPGRLVGKLIYLTITRPNLSLAEGVVSQFMKNPWNTIIHILRYFKKAPGQALLYENKGNTQISGYCDANWDECPKDRHSTTGYYVPIGGNIISWKSIKQNVVVRSNAEVEYRAMTSLT